MEQLTLNQALQLIDDAVSELSLKRKGHELLLRALAVIKAATEPTKEETPNG